MSRGIGVGIVVTLLAVTMICVALAQGPKPGTLSPGRGVGFIDEDGDGVCDDFVDEDGDGMCDDFGTDQRMDRGRGAPGGWGHGQHGGRWQ